MKGNGKESYGMARAKSFPGLMISSTKGPSGMTNTMDMATCRGRTALATQGSFISTRSTGMEKRRIPTVSGLKAASSMAGCTVEDIISSRITQA